MAQQKHGKRQNGDRPRAAAQREQRVVPNADVSRSSTVKLSDPAVRQEVDAMQREITKTRREALAFLHGAGIVTPTGRLSRKFGGS